MCFAISKPVATAPASSRDAGPFVSRAQGPRRSGAFSPTVPRRPLDTANGSSSFGSDETRAERNVVHVRILWQPLIKTRSLESLGAISFYQPPTRFSNTDHDSLFGRPIFASGRGRALHNYVDELRSTTNSPSPWYLVVPIPGASSTATPPTEPPPKDKYCRGLRIRPPILKRTIPPPASRVYSPRNHYSRLHANPRPPDAIGPPQIHIVTRMARARMLEPYRRRVFGGYSLNLNSEVEDESPYCSMDYESQIQLRRIWISTMQHVETKQDNCHMSFNFGIQAQLQGGPQAIRDWTIKRSLLSYGAEKRALPARERPGHTEFR